MAVEATLPARFLAEWYGHPRAPTWASCRLAFLKQAVHRGRLSSHTPCQILHLLDSHNDASVLGCTGNSVAPFRDKMLPY